MPTSQTLLSEEEYLQRELKAQEKSEYHHGQVQAMAGASENHVLIVTNLIAELRNCLKNTDCRVYATDRLLYVDACASYYYPDVMIVCGESETHQRTENIDALVNPRVLIEVLSDSTRGYDLGEKLRCYQNLASLEQFLSVEPDEIRVESFTKQASNQWLMTSIQQKNQKVKVADCEIDLTEIYDKVRLINL